MLPLLSLPAYGEAGKDQQLVEASARVSQPEPAAAPAAAVAPATAEVPAPAVSTASAVAQPGQPPAAPQPAAEQPPAANQPPAAPEPSAPEPAAPEPPAEQQPAAEQPVSATPASDPIGSLASRYTVTFIVSGSFYESVTVDDGSTLSQPAPPAPPAGYVSFKGWSTSGSTSNLYNFATPVRSNLTLHAVFSDTFLVSFLNTDNVVITGIEVKRNTPIPVPGSNVTDAILQPTGKRFVYWYDETDTHSPPADFFAGSPPIASQDVVLRPYLKALKTIIFVSEGTQVPAAYVIEGSAVARPPDPSRDGWAFAGWRTASGGGGSPYSFAAPVNNDLVLYASWTPKTVSYTLAVWMERANMSQNPDWVPTMNNLSHYDYVVSIPMTGTAGQMSAVGTGSGQAVPSALATLLSGTGAGASSPLRYAKFQGAVNKTIVGNGSTVVNVFVQRKIYTYNFIIVGNTATTQHSLLDNANNRYEQGAPAPYVIRAKFEQNIASVYPSKFQKRTAVSGSGSSAVWGDWAATTDFNQWSVSGSGMSDLTNWMSKRLVISSALVSANGQQASYSVTSQWSSAASYQYRYFVESLTGTGDLQLADGTWYVLATEYNDTLHTTTLNYAKPMPGYVAIDANPGDSTAIGLRYDYNELTKTWTQNNSGDYRCYFYNRLNTLTLTYYPNKPAIAAGAVTNMPPNRTNLKYGDYVGPAPDEIPQLEGYMFGGWYKDADLRVPFAFGDVPMPNANLAAYAKWTSTDYSISFYDKPGGELVASQTTGKGQYADFADPALWQVDDPVPGKGQFIGWYWRTSDIYIPYHPDIPVYDDLDLYAFWKIDSFSVSYESGTGGIGTHRLAESETFALGALVRISDGEGLVLPAPERPDDLMMFYGWLLRYANGTYDGMLYYPGSIIEIQGDSVLIAQFAPRRLLFSITYHPNFSLSANSSLQVWVPLAQLGSAGLVGAVFTAPSYQVIGWALTPGAATPAYATSARDVDLSALIDSNDNVDLYAKWAYRPNVGPPISPVLPIVPPTPPVGSLDEDTLGDIVGDGILGGGIGRGSAPRVRATLPLADSSIEASASAGQQVTPDEPSINWFSSFDVPLAGGNGRWALVNLVLAFLGCLFAVMTLALSNPRESARKKHGASGKAGRESASAKRRSYRALWRALNVIAAAGAATLFFLTENTSHLMALFDTLTMAHVGIASAQTALFILTVRSLKEDAGSEAGRRPSAYQPS
jgi:uncharacterized repeat protein (TIGR02543 family)